MKDSALIINNGLKPAARTLRSLAATLLPWGAAALALSLGDAKAALRTYTFSNVAYSYAATGGGNSCTAGTTCNGTLSGYFVWDNETQTEGNGSLTLTKNPVARANNNNCASSNTDCNGSRTYNLWANSGTNGEYIVFWDSNDMIRLQLVNGLSSTDQRYLSFSGASTNDGFNQAGSTSTTNGSSPTFTLSTQINLNSGNNVNIAPNPSLALGIIPFAYLAVSRRKSFLRTTQRKGLVHPPALT